MKNTLLRQIQRMFMRRTWLLLLIFLPLFLPIQTAKPYYKVTFKIRLNPPPYMQVHAEQLKWLSEQTFILNSEKLLTEALKRSGVLLSERPKQVAFLKENMEVSIEDNFTLDVELIMPEKDKLKTIASEITTIYFDMANKERRALQEKLYESQQEQFQSLDMEMKSAKPGLDYAKNALEVFEGNRKTDNTKQIKGQIHELEIRLSELKAVYTEEHPQVKEVKTQIAEKAKDLNGEEGQLKEEHKKELALSENYQKKREFYERLSAKNDSLKTSFLPKQIQHISTIITTPRIIDVGIIETKLLDLTNKLFFGIFIVFLIGLINEKLDKTIWNETEIKSDLGIRTLGSVYIPKRKASQKLLIEYPKDSQVIKSFEIIRSNIQFINLATPLKSILYCSFIEKEDDIFAGNLAISLTYIGGRVCLMNIANATKKYNPVLSLTNAGSFKNLHILDSKGLNIFEKRQAGEFINPLKEKFDVIVIDSPPVADSVTGAALASAVDGVILGVQARKTKREALQRNYKILNEINARVLGTILQW